MQQSGHLVDERARAAGAGAVHALLDAVIEVDDLGVLAAQLDGDVGGRDEGLDGAFAGDDLLDKLQVEPLGQQHAAGAQADAVQIHGRHQPARLHDILQGGREDRAAAVARPEAFKGAVDRRPQAVPVHARRRQHQRGVAPRFLKTGKQKVFEADLVVFPVDGHARRAVERLLAKAAALVDEAFHGHADHGDSWS